MPKSKLDELAGEGSVAGKLKKMREQMESGDEESMHPTPDPKPEMDENDPHNVVRRGYIREK